MSELKSITVRVKPDTREAFKEWYDYMKIEYPDERPHVFTDMLISEGMQAAEIKLRE